MFYSQCLLSRKAPLGAIRVAAYCFKRLKKVQVNETDICLSVDKILQDEINDQTYRVLAALLLGVVRIYSKKVEYLVQDCNEVLLKLKKFRINAKGKGPMETLCATITVPERFELDAFDLEVSEDVGGSNIAPQEDITLKDVWENERIGQFSLDKYQSEDFCCSLNLCSADNSMVEEDFRQSLQMNINFEVAGPSSPTNLQAGKDTSFPEKQMNSGPDLEVKVLTELVNSFSRDKKVDEQKRTEGESYEDEAQNNSIERFQSYGISQKDFNVSCQGEEEPVVPFEELNESHAVAEEQIEARGNQMHQEAEERHEARNSEASVEWIRDGKSYQEECTLHNKSSVYKGKLKEHIEGTNGESHTEQNLRINKYISVEGQMFSVIPVTSLFIDLSPWFRDASTARPTLLGRIMSGSTTPKGKLIQTPAAREGPRFTRKRKCVIDDVIVLSNEEVKQNISDARDLISKRRKSRHSLLKTQQKHRISTLPKGFHDSLLPCRSLELQSLFSKRKVKISESFQTTKTPRELDQLGSYIIASPKTPPRLSTIQSIEGPNDVTPLSPHESLGREQSLRNDEQLSPMNEENINNHCTVETLSSYESLAGGQPLRKDEEHNRMNEDSYSFETQNSQSCAWTGQTMEVALNLHRSFLSLRNQKEGEVVNFSQAFGSKTRKECARVFYEILVLKTTDFVDAEQHDAYGDISIRKLPRWDETFEVDDF